MSSTSFGSTVSIFARRFDVVVQGGGYIGFAAARVLAARGLSVLVIEPTGQLLWESTRALENGTGETDGAVPPCAEWAAWQAVLARHGAVKDGWFDAAFAEILAARDWAGAGSRVKVLCYARPVAVESVDGEGVVAVTVATKAGFRRVRAAGWIDASERGELAALCAAGGLRHREPVAAWRSMVLQGAEADWARHEAALGEFCRSNGVRLSASVRTGERRMSWVAGTRALHEDVVERLTALRAGMMIGEGIIVSHVSAEEFPVYAGGEPGGGTGGLPGNVLAACPALVAESVDSISARFSFGVEVAQRWLRMRPSHAELCEGSPSWEPNGGGEVVPAEPSVVKTLDYDVVVGGAGTAGALAAISAARQGARTAAVDFATFPGGVGTGVGITGYFHGLEGGLQAETDRAAREIGLLFKGLSATKSRWHHEGKKLALLGEFARHGVAFHGGALLCGVEKDAGGRVEALLAATGEGLVRIRARAFVDSTGDGDLCALAGATFDSGREGDGRPLAYSQPAFVLKAGEEPGGGKMVATRNFDAGWTDPTDPEDLSRARLAGVAQHWRAEWTEECPLAISPLPGLRQSRHIHTDYTLTFRDLAGQACFEDAIGEAGSIADTHSVDYEFEDDEAVFFFWVCRLFRQPLRTELPYRMLLPRGLSNVWIACRAAGVAPTAFYAVRMQRDMQRLGEAAGIAAALAVRNRCGAREVDMDELQTRLRSESVSQVAAARVSWPDKETAEARLAAGLPGPHLWQMYRQPEVHRAAVLRALNGNQADASFYAAALLAMEADASAEPRLLAAIAEREAGPPPSPDNTGAHGQEIDIPFWLLAIILLRRAGTGRCIDALEELAERPDNLLNVRTALALTVERLAAGGRVPWSRAARVAEKLVRNEIPDTWLAPSHSIWRRLRGERQLALRNDCGADTREDHSWQLYLVAGRIRQAAGEPPDERTLGFASDPRAVVRQAFARLVGEPARELAG